MTDFKSTRLDRKKKSSFWFLKLIFLLALIFVWFFYYTYSSFLTKQIVENDSIIKINKWDSFYSLPEKLSIDKNLFKLYLKLNTPDFSLQAGSYELESGSNISKIISSLKTPLIKEEKLTILEWWNIFDIDYLLSKRWLIKAWDFIEKYSENEWMYYPDTYNINRENFKLEDFVSKMLGNFDKKVKTKLPLEVQNDEEKLKNLLILASIVEREANIKDNPEEVSIIAGILQKRLDENWFIWADITVCYPYKITSKECTPSFVVNHINDKNDYNTRTMLGLPKTAIWNPSYKTINATLNYKKTPYYYYLHDKSGQINYGRNNAEHVNNKVKYLGY